ncbi:MAG: hypothetical protein K5854_08730 [Prevotella sp.]|jgi:hypothetical protein|nr:hypothetical protein [Prevotella sp.]
MKRKIFLFFALVLAMFGFAGCNLDDDDTTPEDKVETIILYVSSETRMVNLKP